MFGNNWFCCIISQQVSHVSDRGGWSRGRERRGAEYGIPNDIHYLTFGTAL